MYMFGRWSTSIAASIVLIGTAVGQQDFPFIPKSRNTSPLDLGSAPVRRDEKPIYKFELKPEHGNWLVFVRAFKGEEPGDQKPKRQAEDFAQFIRDEYRLPAYIHESGWPARQERDKEKQASIEAQKAYYRSRGIEPTPEMIKVRMIRIPDQYSVLIGPYKGTIKDSEQAAEFAAEIRKLKAPEKFSDRVVTSGTENSYSLLNPFQSAFHGRNPTLPKEAFQVPKADAFLLSLNASESHSLLHHTTKKWTLLVQCYSAGGSMVTSSAGPTGGNDDTSGERLERAAQQASAVVKALRASNDPRLQEAYVMHTRYQSAVCLGQFDSPSDPVLLKLKESMARFQLKDKRTGQVLDTFLTKPDAMPIPQRP